MVLDTVWFIALLCIIVTLDINSHYSYTHMNPLVGLKLHLNKLVI